MDPSIRTAASGMMAQQTRVEVISNNLANVNTTGFKRSRAHFEDLMYQSAQAAETVQGTGTGTLPEVQLGRGTRLSAVQRIDSQGPLEQTGRPLDLAIEGPGFFQVELPNGNVAYTRDGSFSISNVPEGKYLLAAWHEELGELTIEIVVKPKETVTQEITFSDE